jgi:hypothetical protein
MNSVLRFSDFAKEEKPLDGEKRRIDDVLNLDITITGARISDSRYKEETGRKRYMTLQFQYPDNKRCVLFTGSEVLISQIEKYRENIPFQTKIQKIDRYYTFT